MTRSATGVLMRTIHLLAGRSVAIDSWYDAHLGTWRAAGPSYPMLAFARPRAVPPHGASRRAAVSYLLRLFAGHFLRHGPAPVGRLARATACTTQPAAKRPQGGASP